VAYVQGHTIKLCNFSGMVVPMWEIKWENWIVAAICWLLHQEDLLIC